MFKKILIAFILMLGLMISFIRPISASPSYLLSRRSLADVNRDGIVSLLDKKIVRENLGLINPSGISALSDVDQNGFVNIQDLRLVNKYIGIVLSRCEMADINNDRTVNYNDLEILSNYYDQEDNSTNMIADLNGDGLINISDLSIIGGVFNCSW